jgi:Ca2+-binding RTX toxin-like protein
LTAALVLALAAGAAFAVNKMCPHNCRGTGESDRLVGSARGNTIHALEGSDRVKGSFGRDRVYGGPGDDLVRGGTTHQTNDGARDVLECGDGTDTFDATPGVDVVRDNCETPFTP